MKTPNLKDDVRLVRKVLRQYAKDRQYALNDNTRKARWEPLRAFERIVNETQLP